MSLVPYFFELSGEHPTLPQAEAYGCCAAECDYFQCSTDGPGYAVFGFESDRFDGIASRLALTHRLGRYLGSSTPEDAMRLAGDLDLPSGSFAVRAKRFQQHHMDLNLNRLAAAVGGVSGAGRKIDLTSPEVELRLFISDRVHFYLLGAEVDRSQFEARKVAERPFFSPISLHPKFARALVNMTFVKRGDRLLDPFCGTGGVLIEAASIGVRACGSDISPEMVDGCRRNMEHFGLPWDAIEVADIGDIATTFGTVAAVATDPPYGRATSTMREPLGDLYDRAMGSIASVLERGSRAGVVLPRPCPERMDGLELVHGHVQKVHRSLSRNYCVLRRR
ncbi:MAG: RsmD family RNA methyltransferase [Methanomassiliicoccus sp.]|nr:RsmD family RNA methyltransferase [Methanomassiliicoccus sp.]